MSYNNHPTPATIYRHRGIFARRLSSSAPSSSLRKLPRTPREHLSMFESVKTRGVSPPASTQTHKVCVVPAFICVYARVFAVTVELSSYLYDLFKTMVLVICARARDLPPTLPSRIRMTGLYFQLARPCRSVVLHLHVPGAKALGAPCRRGRWEIGRERERDRANVQTHICCADEHIYMWPHTEPMWSRTLACARACWANMCVAVLCSNFRFVLLWCMCEFLSFGVENCALRGVRARVCVARCVPCV